ncbi:putative WRKY transcription factor 59 isoform X1 [Canna indica]|uniref:WRKY transcription factor 59 isoform X1 n=1 Tax=Canna indica TaxID=4628 RepID=A0AAQ3JUX9_9LILI|nr:putative WRKY transcription factor 59 isoform X1 [Canna indica]
MENTLFASQEFHPSYYHQHMSQLQYCSLQSLGHFDQLRKESAARVFSEEVLQQFAVFNSAEVAINMKKSGDEREYGLLPSCSNVNGNVHPGQENIRIEIRSQKISTHTPYSDGYQWRKYGEKKISGSRFPRSYYRCTYRQDKGCQATKQVQQQGHSDPPLFLVTYKGEHTCNAVSTANDQHPQHMLQCHQLNKDYYYSQPDHHYNYNPSFFLNVDNSISSNPKFETATAPHMMIDSHSPAPEMPFCVHFEQPKGFVNGSDDSAASGAAINPNLTADSTFSDEINFQENWSPSSQELDISEMMMMDSVGFDFDNILELFQIF